MNEVKRCDWALKSKLEQEYHDKEWGVPVHDDRKLFKMLTLEGKQAGLSWATILAKMETLCAAFDNYLWSFVNGQPIVNLWTKIEDVPSSTPVSDAISKDMKKHGFKFIGTTTVYALMQSVGMVNDHLTICAFRNRS